MVALRVLIALLSVLLVAHAQLPKGKPEYATTSEEPEYLTSEEPEYLTSEEPEYLTSEEPEYLTTSEEPEYVSTSEEPEYLTTSEEPEYNFTSGNNTIDYNPQVYTVQCGYTQETEFFLGSLPDGAIFEVSSNTTETTGYSSNQECKIQFKTGDSPVWLSVHLEELDLENSTNCYWDSLCIKGAKFCGRAAYPIYLSYAVPSNNTLTIKFKSDSSVTASGFRFRVYSWSTSSDVSSYEPYGIVSNPNEIYNYREVNQTSYVDECSQEYPEFYTTSSYDYYSTQGYPTGEEEQVIECNEYSADNYYYLTSNNYYAFRQYDNNNINRYLFKSANFGNGDYGNNTSCKAHFYTSSVRQALTVYYRSFDLESSPSCSYDSLCVNGVKFCSSWPQGRYFYYEIPAYSAFTLDFETDSSIMRSGFEIELTFEDKSVTYGSYEATSGDGSSEVGLVYSYSDDSSYQDRCASDYNNYRTNYYDQPSTPEPQLNFGDSSIVRSYVRTISRNVDDAFEKISVVKDLLDSLKTPEYRF